MSKPWIHAVSSAKRFGGKPEDYMPIHDFLDSSKGAIADSRHRALTHTSWFLSVVLERVFGHVINNSTGKQVSVRDVGEQHVLEDFGGRFIPTPQDYLERTEFSDWMLAGKGEPPSSFSRLSPKRRRQMNAMDKYQESKQKMEAARLTMKECAKEAFTDAAKAIFDDNPELMSFSWRQYTPYFNDGDECVFSARTSYPDLVMKNQVNPSDNEESEFYSWKANKKDPSEWTPREKAGMAVIAFLGQFDDATYREMFDDHVKVVVSRDGTEVHECEHD